jgi:hypothetical protein
MSTCSSSSFFAWYAQLPMTDGGMALPRVLWNKREGCQDLLRAPCLQHATKGGALGAPALIVIFYEGVPQAGPGLLGCWHICRCSRPKDPLQMGMGLHQGHCRAH